MFFKDKPGWGIALRIVLVLLLIAGMAWIAKAAFYRGVAAGAGKMGPGYMTLSGNDEMMEFHMQDDGMMEFHMQDGEIMEFHHQDGFMEVYGHSGEMFYHHPGTSRSFSKYGGPMGHNSGFNGPMGHYSGYAGQMSYHSRGSFATGFFHLLFGALGFFLLVKLIFGFGGMGMHRYGPKGWGPGGRGYHHGPYRYHRCHCPECSGEGDEEPAPEKAPASKSKKKVA